jgi:ankyrin repeat protein
MKVLIQNGADPFIQSNLNANILHAAVESNALQSLSYAIDICKRYPERLDINQPNVWGESPLHMAAQGCLVDCVRLLLEAGADRTIRQENQQVTLHYAGLSTRGRARRDTVALLCGDHADPPDHVNAQDEDGRPPLFDFLDDPECVEILLSHGARLDMIDASGKNVFHHACIQDENELLQSLLRRSSAALKTGVLKEKDNAGNTVLIEALRHESVDCAITLLSLGDDVDIGSVVGQDGWAAVHYAAKLGDPALLEATLKHRSFQRGAKTRDGKTTEVVAMDSENWCGKVKELLRMYNSLLEIS